MNDTEKEIESLRVSTNKKIKKYNRVGLIVCGLSTVIIIIIALLINFYLLFLLYGVFIMFIIFAVITTSKTSKPLSEFNKIYKEKIVNNVFKKVFDDVIYVPENGIEEKKLEDTHMIYTGDRYHSNDYVKGKYKNINFEFSDVHMTEKHEDSDGNTTYVTIFSGQWMIFDFNKSFKSKLSIGTKYFGILNHSKNVELEDIDFNKNFSVWADHEEDAFYLLTPNYMEKIKKLKEKLNAAFALCFIDNKLYIGLNNYKNLFEPNLKKKINIDLEEKMIVEEIKIITNFIDDLELDNNLFKN